MSLKLNLPNEYIRVDGHKIPFYSEFYGRNVDQMPKLIADGRVPMNVAQLMQRKLDVRNSDAKVKSVYMDNYFDTGDGVAYHPETKDLLIDLDSEALLGIHPNPKRLLNGAWLLGENRDEAFAVYEQIKAKSTSVLIEKKYLGKVNEGMSREYVKAHPVWKVLLRHPDAVPREIAIPGLLEESVDYIFGEYQARFAKGKPLEDVKTMEVFPGSECDQPKIRAWCVLKLGDRSVAYGMFGLGSDDGRHVGIAPEALSALGNGTNVRTYTMADLQAVDKATKGLEGTLPQMF